MVNTHNNQVAGADVVWHELRAMRTFDLWGKYVCGALDRRTHVVDIGRPAPRTLIRGEAFWWVQGFADARGDGARVQALLREKVPRLLTMEAAGELVPALKGGQALTEQGVRRTVGWYPLHVPKPPGGTPGRGGRSRYVFWDQVDAEAARRRQSRTAEKTALRWQALQEQLPPLVRMADAVREMADGGRDITPAESPDPLPILGGRAEAIRRAEALRVGHHQGWFAFRHPTAVGFLVDLSGGVRELPAEGALPWVLGFADAIGPQASVLVAYRPGLG